MATVYLGIGSNLGDRQKNIEEAKTCLLKNGIQVLKASPLIETEPAGGPPGQGKFLNGALKTTTGLPAPDLLRLLKQIEKSLGRTQTVVNGPRVIDLDILLYDDLAIQTPGLTIPHPRMLKRDFVMKPLNEIEPELVRKMYHAHR